MNKIKSIEVIDNKYHVTMEIDVNHFEVITLNSDEFGRLHNLIKTASIQSKGIVHAIEEAKPEIDIEEKLVILKEELLKEVKQEIDFYRKNVSSLSASVKQLLAEDGVYEKINQSAIDRLDDSNKILNSLTSINQTALEKIKSSERNTAEALQLIKVGEAANKLEIEQLKKTANALRETDIKSQKVLNEATESQKTISSLLVGLDKQIKETIENTVSSEIEKIRKLYSDYTDMVKIRNEISEKIANDEIRRIAVSETNVRRMEEEQKEHSALIQKTKEMISVIEKDKQLLIDTSEQARIIMQKKVIEILNVFKANPGDFDSLIKEVEAIILGYDKAQKKEIHRMKLEAMNKIEKEAVKEKKVDSLLGTIRGLFRK